MKLKFINALWRCRGMTADRLRKIQDCFPDLKTAWNIPPEEFTKIGIKKEAAEVISDSQKDINPEKEWERLESLKIKLITKQDPIYPKNLREIPSSPEVLYIKGEIKPEDELALTVVGSRAISQYGRRVVEKIVEPISANNVTIISGLALGTDGAAHQAALKSKGRTIAVLANGLEKIYPATNTKLAEQILDGRGAIISEYPLDTEPLRQRFPARNRIVAGLSQGTLIIEAAVKSGSLITAKMAMDFNRKLFAVPGLIFSDQSQGTNNLLKDPKTRLVDSPEDILSALDVNTKNVQIEFNKSIPENPLEIKIYNLLSHEPISADEIMQETSLGSGEVSSSLTLMEMRGQAKSIGGGMWIKN